MTPLQLHILLQCATCELSEIGSSAAHREAIGLLERQGAVTTLTGGCRITDLGMAWVSAACLVEKPRRVWVDARGRELEGLAPGQVSR